jgi:TolB-like protein
MNMRREFVNTTLAKVLLLSALLILGYGIVGCASLPTPSTVVIKRAGDLLDDGKLYVYLDGKVINENQPVGKGQTRTLAVTNGSHRIWVEVNQLVSDKIQFTVENSAANFNVSTQRIGGSKTLLIEPGSEGKRPGTASASPPAQNDTATGSRAQGAASGIGGAISQACETLIYELPRKSTVAVLGISSRNRDMAVFAMDEIEFQLVGSQEFEMVDRKTLDSVREEQNFQMSGDVSDDSAVTIGTMLGADIVITGSITGSGNTQRLTVKALDVTTAKIVTMAREQF